MNEPSYIGAIRELICSSDNIAIIPHVFPDGDALGSALGLKCVLERTGKTARVYSPNPVPDFYDYMPGASSVLSADDANGVSRPFDLVIAVDSADESRLGDCAVLLKRANKTAIIDHHSTNECKADAVWIDKDASATCVLIWKLAAALSVPLNHDIALCLYTGLSTDTGHFSQRNTNADAFRAASACLEAGIDAATLVEHLHKLRSLAKTRLLSRALESLQVFADGKVVAMKLSREDFAWAGATDIQTEGIIDFGIAVRGSLAAVMCSEREGLVRVSMRSRPPISVSDTATKLGGGGHPLAAGITLPLPLADAYDTVVGELVKDVLSHG
ncbi:MAG: bifunctional oligoribonuclease/PAP phosphatase NrnA [Oscillospiraceae bacterium]|jgi:phosphoesterase RecJ-like protein|nr:bifunctional oligoribonuclease/PAP phosphatase NrnA [Oscillospiraceae bacterium]